MIYLDCDHIHLIFNPILLGGGQFCPTLKIFSNNFNLSKVKRKCYQMCAKNLFSKFVSKSRGLRHFGISHQCYGQTPTKEVLVRRNDNFLIALVVLFKTYWAEFAAVQLWFSLCCTIGLHLFRIWSAKSPRARNLWSSSS